jgi:hypothetical protein
MDPGERTDVTAEPVLRNGQAIGKETGLISISVNNHFRDLWRQALDDVSEQRPSSER